MVLISKSFRRPTRPSLQTAPRPADARVAAVAPQGDCSRSTGDACADTRANNRDGVEPTRAAPAPGSRGSRHRSAAWPVASVAVAHVDTSMHCSTSDPGLATCRNALPQAAHRRISMAALSAQGKSERSAFGAARLQTGWHAIPATPPRRSPSLLRSPHRAQVENQTGRHRPRAVGPFP